MEPECVVCLQVFDEGEHTPRVLSCGHSVCQSCVADLRSHWGAGSPGSSSSKGGHVGGGLVRCPECKQHTKVPLRGFLDLPKNIELMRLIQGVPKAPIANKSRAADVEETKKEQSRRKEDEDSTLASPLSEVVHGEPVIWILPQAAVKRRKDVVHGVCVGDMVFCEKKLQSKVQEVSLQVLSTIDPKEGKKLKYKELVRLAWETLNPKIRAKLMRLLAVGCGCNYFTEVAGLWMSGEGILYLVSKVYVDGIKQARSLFLPTTDNSRSSDHGTAQGEDRSDNIGRSSVRTLIRLGVELCEMLMEIHGAGLFVGILRGDSFSLDAHCHLRLHVGKCVFWTRPVGDSYECFSPEVCEIMKKFEDSDISAAIARGSGDEAGHEADVWSLGFLLLQLLCGSSLLGGVMQSEAHDIVRGNRTEPEVLEENVGLKEQLLNCMAAVPSNRPRVVDVWRELKELLDDQALETPSHLIEDSWEDKVDMETCEPGSITAADDSWVEAETASEARANAVRDPQSPPIEATTDAPSLSRALIDAIDCDAEVRTLQGHVDTVSCLSVCGRFLISTSFDKTLRVWSLNDYSMVQTLNGHEYRITALAVYEASELCISGDYGGYIKAWNVASRGNSAMVAAWQEHNDWRYSGVASLAISSEELLYSGSGDRTIKAWSISDLKRVATMEGHEGVVSVLMVEGQILFSGSWDGTIRLWWRPDHSPLANFDGGSSVPRGGIRALVKCPASGLLFSGHDSGVIQIWNEEDCVGTFKAHTGVISALAFDQDWLYSSSWDGFVKAWPLEDVLSGGPVPVERKCNQAAVTALCCSGQAKLFVGTTQKIQVYNHEVVI